ncbi:MAG: caspase family protein [Gemmatimonadetes bacterium]|nr:caspase family protein [Gemmatimonadota bacterium]
MPGDTISFTIQVANSGPDHARQLVVHQQIPDGLTLVSASHGGQADPNGIVSWPEVDTLRSGNALSYQVRVVPSAASRRGRVDSWARVNAVADAGSPTTSATTISTTVLAVAPTLADLEITKSGPDNAAPGDTIVYTIRIRNLGPRAAELVDVTDVLPATGAFIDASGGGVMVGGTVRWPRIPVLAANGGATFTVRMLAPECGQTLIDLATVTAQAPPDPDPANNTSTSTTVIAGGPCDTADVEVSKIGPLVVVSGDTLTYTIRVTNRGPSTAFGIAVADTLPATGRFLSANPQAVPVGRIINWPVIPALAAGATQTYSVTFEAPTSGENAFTNTVTVRSASPTDPDTTNNIARVTTLRRLEEEPIATDVEILKTGPSSVSVSDTIIYTITVRNRGLGIAAGIQVTDTLPVSGTFVSASGGGTRSGRVVSWPTTDSLLAGGSLTFTIRHLAPACPDTLVNVAVVRTVPADSIATNNLSAVTTRVTGPACLASLRLVKQAVDTFRVGSQATFRLAVTNAGTLTTTGPVTVTDTLPPGLTFLSGSGPGWVVTAAGAIVTAVYGGVLQPGATASFDLTVSIDAAAIPQVCNRAWARSPPAASAFSETCVSVEFGELSITKSASRTEVEIGDFFEYRLTVSLAGNAPARGVFVRDVLPTGLRYVRGTSRIDGRSVPDPVGAPGPLLTFDVGTVLLDRDVEISYRVLVGPGTPVGDVINRAIAIGDDGESGEASARVRVRAGIFSDEAMIVGKIFVDSVRSDGVLPDRREGDPDRRQTHGEFGVPGVRVWLQDGTSAITDEDGEFLFYALSPRTWIVKVDTSTLPRGARLEPISHRHSRDGQLVEVELKRGELHRADFAVRSDSVVFRDVENRHKSAGEAGIRIDSRPFFEANPGSVHDSGVRLRTYRPLAPEVSAAELDRRIRNWGARSGDALTDTVPGEGMVVGVAGAADTARVGSTIAFGLVEARVDFRSLTDTEIGGRSRRNRFEDELRNWATREDDGRMTAGTRAALLYRGVPSPGWGLTVRLDSEEDDRVGLFRDIRPDALYPVWGDASVRSYGAQTRGRVFGMLENGDSYLSYGDFNTGEGMGVGLAGAENGAGAILGRYSRSLTGLLEHWETRWGTVTGWAANERSRQVVDVITALGISGPYALSRTDGLVNSERVELVTRDRNQPATILRVEPLLRFLDYAIEPLTGRLLLKRPVASVDEALNPVEIRVTYEVESGGDRSWAWGANGRFKPAEFLEVGGSIVRDDNGLSRLDLAGLNATLRLGATFVMGELARTENGVASGDASRIEVRHDGGPVTARAFFLDSDATFRNPSSPAGHGRRELGFIAAAQLGPSTRILGEALSTEDRLTDARLRGGRIGLEQALTGWLRGQVAYRHADESGRGTTQDNASAVEVDAIGIRLRANPSGSQRAGVQVELEQDVNDSGRRRAEVAADYEMPGLPGVRLYARHELISSFSGPWGLIPGEERNSTVFGVAMDQRAGQAAFSEYRISGAAAGREAQAAVGLRNSWQFGDGVRLGTSFERIEPIGGGRTTATAVTGAIELTGSPLWKSSARLEFRTEGERDNLFGSLAYARRLSASWTLLGTTAFSTVLDSGPAYERTRVGIAYRPTEQNAWNGLARYEHRYDRKPDDDSIAVTRSAHILAAHADFRPVPRLLLRGEWASRFAAEELRDRSISESSHVLGGRATLDLLWRFDLGGIGRALFAGTGGTRFGLGAEAGVLLADNLRLSAGYNVFGFRDRELSAEEHTDRGFFIRLGFKFDEGLFDRRTPAPEPTPPGRPTDPATPDDPEARVDISGPDWVLANDTIPPVTVDTIVWVISTRRVPGEVAGRGVLRVRISWPDPRVIDGPPAMGVSGPELWWPVRPPPASSGIRRDTLRLLVPMVVPIDSLLRVWARVEGPSRQRPPRDTAEFETRVRRRPCPELGEPGARQRPADLAAGIFGPNSSEPGDTLDFTITLRNLGGASARSVQLRLTPPRGFAVIDSGGAVRSNDDLLWLPGTAAAPAAGGSARTIRDLSPDQADTVSIRIAAPGIGTASEIIALASTVSFEADRTNNLARRSVRTGPIRLAGACSGPDAALDPLCGIDLNIVVDAGPSAFEGDTVPIVLRSSNEGPSATARVVITANIGSADFVGASGGGQRMGESISWLLPSAVVARAVRTDTVWIVCPAGRAIVTASIGGDGVERNPDNNQYPAEIACQPNVADLAVRIDIMPGEALQVGGVASWVITTTNLGPRRATSVEVQAEVPGGGRLESAQPAATPLGGGVRWVGITRVEPGDSIRHVIHVRLTAAGTVLIRATASSTTEDANPLNNERVHESSVAPQPVFPPPRPPERPDTSGPADPTRTDSVRTTPPDPVVDLRVLLLPLFAVDHAVTLEMTAENIGALPAANVEVEASWPDGVAFVRASGDWTLTRSGIRWTALPVLESGVAVRDTLVLMTPRAPPGPPVRLPIPATVRTTTSESELANNRFEAMAILQQITITDTLRVPTPAPWWPPGVRWLPWLIVLLLAAITALLIVLLVRFIRRPGPRYEPAPSAPVGPHGSPGPAQTSPPSSVPIPPVAPWAVAPIPAAPVPPAGPPVPVPPVAPAAPPWWPGGVAPFRMPGHPDGDVYGHITIDGASGTGYLVDAWRFVTCAHLVQRRKLNGEVTVRYLGRTLRASIEAIDSHADVAVLRLEEPIEGVKPLEFAPWIPRLLPLDGYAYVSRDPDRGSAVRGVVVDARTRDRFGTEVLTLIAPELAEEILDPDHARAGGPLFIDGRIVGHIRGRVPHPDTLARTFAGLVQATPAKRILELLGRTPPPEERSGESGGRFVNRATCNVESRAYVSYAWPDAAFAERLARRLEGAGYAVFPAARGSAADGLATVERDALRRSGIAIIVHSRHTRYEESALDALEERLARDSSYRLVVVRADESTVPERLRRHHAVDFCGASPDDGKALQRLETALTGELDPARSAVREAIARSTDEVVRELYDARGRVRRIRFMARRWRESGVPNTQPDLLAAELLVEANRPELADEVLRCVPAHLRGDGVRIRQLEAAVLLEHDREPDALAVIDGLVAEGTLDPRTAGRFAEVLVERWIQSGRRRHAFLRKAFDLLSDVFERTGHAESGSFAACCAMLLGMSDDARALAERARSALESEPGRDATTAAALGLANLLLGDGDAAVDWLGKAIAADPDDVERMARIGRTARLLARKVEGLAGSRDALEARLAEVLRLPRIAVFGVEFANAVQAGAALPSPEAEALASRKVRELVSRMDIGFGIGCLSSMRELLIAEEILRRGGQLRIVLPFARNAFVPLVAGADAARYERVLDHPSVRATAPPDPAPPLERLTDVAAHCTTEMLRVAEERAIAWGQKPVVLLAGDGAGGDTIGAGLSQELFDTIPLDVSIRSIAVQPVAAAVPPESAAMVHPAPGVTPGDRDGGVAEPAAGEPSQTRDAKRRMLAQTKAARGYRKLHLLAVGIDEYAEWRPLANAVNDARGVAQMLESAFGFHTRLVLNGDATRANISRIVVDELSEDVEADDLFVFFFAGHGHTERLKDDEEHGYLVPVDARDGSKADLLRMEEVVSWTENLASRHVLYVFDSCFSGFAALAGGFTKRGKPQDARVAIAAGTAEQVVLDGGAAAGGAAGHSVFTGYLLECLATPEPGGGGVDDMTLYQFVRSRVEAATNGAQEPVHGALPGHGTGRVRFPGRTKP